MMRNRCTDVVGAAVVRGMKEIAPAIGSSADASSALVGESSLTSGSGSGRS